MSTIKTYFSHYEDELTITSEAFYAWKKIHNLAQHDISICSAIDRNALFWTLILHSLQCTFFITLGRIFDTDDDSLTVKTLLEYCKNNIHDFSKANLRARKIEMCGNNEPDWLEKYMQDVYEPCENDFQVVQDYVDKQREIFNKCKIIRNKIYGHADRETKGRENELFKKINLDEIQSMLENLHAVRMFLHHLIYNGYKFDLKDLVKSYDEKICEDIENLMATLKSFSSQQSKI